MTRFFGPRAVVGVLIGLGSFALNNHNTPPRHTPAPVIRYIPIPLVGPYTVFYRVDAATFALVSDGTAAYRVHVVTR